jgi:hypothetical protein
MAKLKNDVTSRAMRIAAELAKKTSDQRIEEARERFRAAADRKGVSLKAIREASSEPCWW